MKLKEVAENDRPKFSRPENNFDILDPEWENQPDPTTLKSMRKKMLSLDHQADLMMGKLETWTKVAKDKVFTVTGIKSGLKLPKHVEKNPRKFLSWTLIHSNANVVTKVYCDKDDIKVLVPVRALISRHNELTNLRAKMEGQLKGQQALNRKPSLHMDTSGSMSGK